MHIIVAPNAFKNSLTAGEAADAIAKGLNMSAFRGTVTCFPIGDGGDGTGELIVRHLGGRTIPATVQDPLGRPMQTNFGLIGNGRTAVIEMASASGIRLLDKNELDPLHASTFGTGELIRQALDLGVRSILLGIGGSATVDGGCGILQALGVRFLNGLGQPLGRLPEQLTELRSIDLSGLDKRLSDCEIIVLCDVDNKLLGPLGSASVFGPQKGASRKQVDLLEASLRQLNDIFREQSGLDMAGIERGGAAGGVAAGLHGFLQARLVNGIDYFLEITGFAKILATGDLLITGEGSLDEQTLNGKGPFGVAKLAKEKGIPVIGLAGRVPLKENAALDAYFTALLAIGNEPADLSSAMRSTSENLTRTARVVGNLCTLQGHA